jgi:hypothetical protein
MKSLQRRRSSPIGPRLNPRHGKVEILLVNGLDIARYVVGNIAGLANPARPFDT